MLLAQARDELAGEGLFAGRQAQGDRRVQLEVQIQEWEQLLRKLGVE